MGGLLVSGGVGFVSGLWGRFMGGAPYALPPAPPPHGTQPLLLAAAASPQGAHGPLQAESSCSVQSCLSLGGYTWCTGLAWPAGALLQAGMGWLLPPLGGSRHCRQEPCAIGPVQLLPPHGPCAISPGQFLPPHGGHMEIGTAPAQWCLMACQTSR